MELAAQLVVAKHPPRVIYVSGLGDYDTHQGLAARHPVLMADLDLGLDTFFTTLDAAGGTDRALVMTVSEFGRRPAENGSGTDHGTAAPHFLIGAGVKGGRYGAPPSLTQLDTQRQPRARGRLPHAVRDRRAGLARRRRRGDRRQGLRAAPRPRLTGYRRPMKVGIFYEHQLPRPWEEGAEARLIRDALDQCELADAIGIDYVWEVEHHFLEEYSHSSAPEVFLGAVSQRTKRIRLGHGIVQTPPAVQPSRARRRARGHARSRVGWPRRLRHG